MTPMAFPDPHQIRRRLEFTISNSAAPNKQASATPPRSAEMLPHRAGIVKPARIHLASALHAGKAKPLNTVVMHRSSTPQSYATSVGTPIGIE